jgi:hypothetical protein
MSQLAFDRPFIAQAATSQWGALRRVAGWATLAQLLCLLLSVAAGIAVGLEPATAQEYFATLQDDRVVGLLRLDFPTLVMICLFTITSYGIYGALQRSAGAYAGLATVLVYVGVVLALANHSAFSMIRLSDLYAAATTAAAQEQLLVAGEAVIAGDMWHSTSGFLAGTFMQGGFVLVSAVMLRSKSFSKGTAVSGLAANGLDFLHVFVGLVLPSVATTMLWIAGVFYLAWFPLLARDLLKRGDE